MKINWKVLGAAVGIAAALWLLMRSRTASATEQTGAASSGKAQSYSVTLAEREAAKERAKEVARAKARAYRQQRLAEEGTLSAGTTSEKVSLDSGSFFGFGR